MVWRRVQEPRPSCSTSGGQSAESCVRVAVAAAVVAAAVLGVGSLAIAFQLLTSVHERHLH
jgi:hypothetical protein